MAENNAWSSFRLYRALSRLTKEAFDAKRTSFFPSLPWTLNHILTVDWFYIDGLIAGGRGQACFAVEIPFPELGDLDREQRASDMRLVAYVRGLEDDAQLDREVQLDRGDHVQLDTARNVLLHLFQHQIHHRGQAHAMLAGTDVAPPQLDEFFMRDELPLRKAELELLGLPLR